MFPAATLFLEVCVQRELWPGGSWPLVDSEAERRVVRVLELAAGSPVRYGSIRCRHGADGYAAAIGAAPHAEGPQATERPAGVPPIPDDAYVMDSGCGLAPDEGVHAEVFRRMTAGIRDAVVFGAGAEYGIARAIGALLRRRIRTHLVLDAAGVGEDVAAQLVVAALKRRGLDVLTSDVVARWVSRR